MDRLIHRFTEQFSQDTLFRQEKARTIVTSVFIAIPSILIAIVLHIVDQKQFPVLFADIFFLIASFFALQAVRKRKLTLAGNTIIFSLIFLIIMHNIVTDYFYADDLTYYRILETTLLYVLISLSIPLFMQRSSLIAVVTLLGVGCIVTQYFIIASKTGLSPWETHPLSILVAYIILFLVINKVAYQMQKIFVRLLNTAEAESSKVARYNQELESMVLERTQTLELQNHELKKVNSELDRFVYSASHDLRAPLTSVLGLIQVAKMEDDVEQVKYYLGLQEKSINKLDRFIQDIVNVSKNARIEIRQDEINFREIIEGILDQLDYMQQSELIEKQVEIQQDIPFYSDQYRLGIILNNLLSNAIRYASPHRRTSFIRVHVVVNADEAILEIEDNGRGIAEDHLEKIFDMFFRANQDSMGSGLGLYIVKETLEKLGGQISVSSTLGKGTIFTAKIPSEVPCHSLSTT